VVCPSVCLSGQRKAFFLLFFGKARYDRLDAGFCFGGLDWIREVCYSLAYMG